VESTHTVTVGVPTPFVRSSLLTIFETIIKFYGTCGQRQLFLVHFTAVVQSLRCYFYSL